MEYVVRGLGFIRNTQDLEETVIHTRDHTPIRIRDVARVTLGPAQRRGALDDGGAESVGGVVVVRFGANPRDVIQRVKERIAALEPGLPRRVLEDGTVSQVRIMPFYDRTLLIDETLKTLSGALWQQLLVTLIVVLLMLRSVRAALLIAAVLPLAILGAFVAMKVFGIEANIMALAGIAIAIGTMVDMGIVFVESISAKLASDSASSSRLKRVISGAVDVAPAVLTSVLTTIISFLPVFALTAAEGKLFRPLAFTKSFAMAAAFLVAMLLLPAAAHVLLRRGGAQTQKLQNVIRYALVAVAGLLLAYDWLPLGEMRGLLSNLLFAALCIGVWIGAFYLFKRFYMPALAWCLAHQRIALSVPTLLVALALVAWLGFGKIFSFLPQSVLASRPVAAVAHAFPGFGREFMPAFDEGSFLYMPTTMPHASIGQALSMLREMDAAIAAIPEVEQAVGKLGRAETALDPAPISMFETMVRYRPEYGLDAEGERVRQWRDHIRKPDDIWEEIVQAAASPGLTSAPKLMPINTRIVMLQSGMRAPMGIKVYGRDLATNEAFGRRLEKILKNVPGVRPESVFADRVVGKPYVEIVLDRESIGRYGLSISAVQEVIQVALGGKVLTKSVEGRERYGVRVRYMREERDSVEALQRVRVPSPGGAQIPLQQLADIRYSKGPQVIKAEDTFLTSYVLFDRQPDRAEVDVVEAAQREIFGEIEAGRLEVPVGVRYRFAGSYENQLRSERRLKILIPLALTLIFLILYLQFRRVGVTLIVFSGVAICVAGGILLLWLYGRPGFMHVPGAGDVLREVFRIGPVNLSVAVWVGFIALLGIATDAGVLLATFIGQHFAQKPPTNVEEIHAGVLQAGERRLRPCLMTAATTALALLPVITAQGRGADVMVPMALPSVGGMVAILLTLFVVPVLYARLEARKLRSSVETES